MTEHEIERRLLALEYFDLFCDQKLDRQIHRTIDRPQDVEAINAALGAAA